jgi:inhibitor of cysteine peptidase
MRRDRSFTALALLALGAVALTVPACSGDDSNPTVYHEGDSISVKSGDEFVVALEANPSTGYSWDAGDNPNVEFVSSKQVSGDSDLAGAGGTQELTFKATRKGSSTLELAYARPFEGGVPPVETAEFPVKVSSPTSCARSASRDTRLAGVRSLASSSTRTARSSPRGAQKPWSGMPLRPPSGFVASTWCTWIAPSSKRAALTAM